MELTLQASKPVDRDFEIRGRAARGDGKEEQWRDEEAVHSALRYPAPGERAIWPLGGGRW